MKNYLGKGVCAAIHYARHKVYADRMLAVSEKHHRIIFRGQKIEI